MDAQYSVVTLVHGTVPHVGRWPIARRGTWIDADSALCRRLGDALGTVVLDPFLWSGRNSHNDRLTGGRDLSAHLLRKVAEHPGARHVIVAHSHGGNVVMYALRELPPAVQKRFVVVCLATPFIIARKRDIARQRWRLAFTLIVGGTAWGIALILALASYGGAPGPGTAAVLALCLAANTVSILATLRLARASTRGLEETATRYENTLTAVVPPHVPMLCLMSKRDEARMWLDLVSFVPSILTSAWERMVGPATRFIEEGPSLLDARLIVRAIGFLLSGSLLLYVAVLFSSMVLVPFGLLAIAGAMLAHLIVIFTVLTRSTSFGFGESWLLNWIVEVSAKPSPFRASSRARREQQDGLITLGLGGRTTFQPTAVEEVERVYAVRQFHHVAMCDDAETVDSICAWLRRQSARR